MLTAGVQVHCSFVEVRYSFEALSRVQCARAILESGVVVRIFVPLELDALPVL
jgi:hypothetical protein